MTITYEYDNIGNVERVLKNGTPIYSCELDADMQLTCEQDYMADSETQYFYTDAGSLYLSRKTCGDDVILSYTITDDETGKTDNITEINGTKITYSSVYDEETEIYKYILPNLTEITSDTDDFGRTTAVYLKDSEGNTILSCTYTYVDKTVDGAVHTSEYVSSMSMGGKTFTYAYDANGNITSVSDGAYVTTYVYDNLGQLTRENNQRAGKSWTYTYDTAGNILSKSEYAYTANGIELGTSVDTVTYTYSTGNWGDQLTSYNGTAITYDALGNPLNWTDGRTFTWEGRQLSSITSSDETISFTYNADGLRTRKVYTYVDDADYVYDYIWQDGLLISETETYDGVETVSYYYYDENGSPVAWNCDGDIYYYVKNRQGDIVKVVDESGTTQAEYTYDAWGNVLTETGNFYVRTYNPFRYRGYYYDVETELYYLQSRYYDPAVGRFLNADAVDYLGATGTVLGYNLYSYCENNAVVHIDLSGFSIWSFKSDWAGINILNWYLYGKGKDRVLTGSRWASYMKDNVILTKKVRKILESYIYRAEKNKTIYVKFKTKMVIDNGEDIIGYQYLHGTNADVGGFYVEIFIRKLSNGKIRFTSTFIWNDIIDPNPQYASDKIKAKFASIITFGKAKPYTIAIIWSDISVLNTNGKWESGWMAC